MPEPTPPTPPTPPTRPTRPTSRSDDHPHRPATAGPASGGHAAPTTEPGPGSTGAATTGLPRWDPWSIGPADERGLAAAEEAVLADLDRLRARYDAAGVGGGPARDADADDQRAVAEVLDATNAVLADVRALAAHLHARVSIDAGDDDAAGRQSALQTRLADLARLTTRLDAWLASLGGEALADPATDPPATVAEHAFALRRAAEQAAHQLSPAEEDLVADLRLSGSVAWARLHREVTAGLTATVAGPDGDEVLPMSVVRGRATHPDPAVRRAAYEAELVAWPTVAVPLAAALNGAKGETGVLNRRRGWPDDLAPALAANHVDAAVLDAMTGAVVDALPAFRAHLRTKAAALGHPAGAGLPWWDLLAPVGSGPASVEWGEAVARVRTTFAGYAPDLGRLADQAVTDGWIDAEPRAGKVGGAFCLPVRGEESRVLVNFHGSLDGVQTLAHELGHAYHNRVLGPRTPLQRRTPMALAETASIFCETLVVEAGLATADDDERLALLTTDLQGSVMVVVDIHSRFLFEQALCERRRARTLSVTELCDLMLDAQERAYGDGIDPDHRHPWMWAVKGHYFTPFYNWPYTYGLLFGLGLYARFHDDPEQFRTGYDDLLSRTGMADAATLAAGFGIDPRDPAFWASSLTVITDRMDAFAALARHASNPA
ncbi:MAG: M3 family oligoendopeptidase [Acidimicrobiales bacterium]